MKRSHEFIYDNIINKIINMTLNYSLTYTGVIVMVLGEVLKLLGVDVGSSELTTTVVTVGQFLGALLAFWGRFRLGDVTLLGVKK